LSKAHAKSPDSKKVTYFIEEKLNLEIDHFLAEAVSAALSVRIFYSLLMIEAR